MPKFTVKGVLYKKGEIKRFGAENKPFYKREMIIEEKFNSSRGISTELIKMFLVGNNVKNLDRFEEGDIIIAHCKINGRKWTPPNEEKEVYFTEIIAYGVASESDTVYINQEPEIAFNNTEEEDEPLPF